MDILDYTTFASVTEKVWRSRQIRVDIVKLVIIRKFFSAIEIIWETATSYVDQWELWFINRRKKRKQKKKSITYWIDDGTVERKYSLLSALISESQSCNFSRFFPLCVFAQSNALHSWWRENLQQWRKLCSTFTVRQQQIISEISLTQRVRLMLVHD